MNKENPCITNKGKMANDEWGNVTLHFFKL